MSSIYFLFVLLASPNTWAYIPPAEFIVDQSIKNRSDIRTIELGVKVSDLVTRTEFKENVFLDFNLGKGFYQILNNREDHLGAQDFDLVGLKDFGNFWFILGIDSSPFRTREALSSLGVIPNPTTVVSLGRIDDLITWFWGDSSRIDFEKDEFIPVHFSEKDDRNQFLVKEKLKLGSSWIIPKIIEISSEHNPTYKVELRSVKVNPKKRTFEGPPQESTNEIIKRWLSLVH